MTLADQSTLSREQRLDELLDRQEINDCLLRFSRGIDRQDSELAKSAYHPDAIDDHIAFVGSGADLVDWVSGYQGKDGWVRGYLQRAYAQHYNTNVSIELDGDVAHVESYYQMVERPDDEFAITQLMGGRYIDRFEKRDGRWAIAARILTVGWSTDATYYEAVAALGPPSPHDRSDLSYLRPLEVQRPNGVFFGPGTDDWE
jgi:hypothetical protein